MPTIDEIRKSWGEEFSDWTAGQIVSYLAEKNKLSPEAVRIKLGVDAPNEGGLMSSVKRGFGQAVSGAGDWAREQGPDATRGLGQYLYREGKEIAENNPAQYNTLQDILAHPVGAAVEGLGEAGGQMPPMVVGAMGGAATGARLGGLMGPWGAVAGGAVGGIAGAFASSYPVEYSQIREDQREKGLNAPTDITRAKQAAAAAAAFDAGIGPEAKLGRILTKKGIALTEKEAAAIAEKGFGKYVGQEALKGGAAEGATEIPQTLIEKWGSYDDPLATKSLDEALVSGYKAFFGGGAFGGVFGTKQHAVAEQFRNDIIQSRNLMVDPSAPYEVRTAAADFLESVARNDFGDDSPAMHYLSAMRDKLHQEDSADLQAGLPLDALAAQQRADHQAKSLEQYLAQQRDFMHQNDLNQVAVDFHMGEHEAQQRAKALADAEFLAGIGNRHAVDFSQEATPNPDARIALPDAPAATPNPVGYRHFLLQKQAAGRLMTPYELAILRQGAEAPLAPQQQTQPLAQAAPASQLIIPTNAGANNASRVREAVPAGAEVGGQGVRAQGVVPEGQRAQTENRQGAVSQTAQAAKGEVGANQTAKAAVPAVSKETLTEHPMPELSDAELEAALKVARQAQPTPRYKGWADPTFKGMEDGKAKSLLRGLLTLVDRPREQDNPRGKQLANVAAVDAHYGDGTAEMFRRIATLAEERDKLADQAASTRVKYFDKQGKARTKGKETLSQFTIVDQQGLVEGNTPYSLYEDRLAEVNRQLMAQVRSLEDRLGEGNAKRGHATLQAIQKASKDLATKQRSVQSPNDKTAGQTNTATRFSRFYADFNSGAVTDERPMGAGLSGSAIREENKLQKAVDEAGIDQKIEEIARDGFASHGNKRAKVQPKGAIGLLNYFGTRGAGSTLLWQRRLADSIRQVFEKVGAPEVVFHKEDYHESVQADGTRAQHPAYYDTDTNTIHVYAKGRNARDIMHEMTHAALYQFIEAQFKLPAKARSAAFNDLALMRDVVRQGLDTKETAHIYSAIKDLNDKAQMHEIVAYALTDRSAQEVLSKIKLDAKLQAKFKLKDAWSLVLHVIRKIFGMNGANDSALEKLVQTSGALLEEAGSANAKGAAGGELFTTVLKVPGYVAEFTHPVLKNPMRHEAEQIVEKYGNDARAFINENGRITHVFAPDKLVHANVAAHEGWTRQEGKANYHLDTPYFDAQGGLHQPVWLDRKGNDLVYYKNNEAQERVELPHGAFSGETENNKLFSTAAVARDEHGAVDQVADVNMTKYARSASVFALPFQMAGYDRAVDSAGKAGTKLKEAFIKAFPRGAALAATLDFSFCLPHKMADAIDVIERSSNAPIAFANALASWIARPGVTTDVKLRLLNALDDYNPTRKDSLEATKVKHKLSAHEAALVQDYREALDKAVAEYVGVLQSRLDPNDKVAYTKGMRDIKRLQEAKPSELMYRVHSKEDTRSAGFNATAIRDFAARSAASIPYDSATNDTLIAPRDADGKLATNGGFYAIYALDLEGNGYVSGFVHETMADNFQARTSETLDTSRRWFFDGASQGGLLKFVANDMSLEEALKTRNADQLANDLRNTIDLMDKVISANKMTEAIVQYGRRENGDQLVFDSYADALEAHPELKGRARMTVTALNAANASIISHMRQPNMWVEVEDSPRFGALAGKVVNGSVWAAVQDIHHTGKVINSPAYNTVLRWFKKNKTAYSPGTHIVNIGSNISWMYLHDIPATSVIKGVQLYYKATMRPESLKPHERAIWKAFAESGALLADYSSAEIKAALSDATHEALRVGEDEGTFWGDFKKMAVYEKAKAAATSKYAEAAKRAGGNLDTFLTGLYAAEDNAFRLAAFMSHAGTAQKLNGGKPLTREQLNKAAQAAAREFLDYNIHARTINALKQTVLPFVSWPYRALPAFAKIAATKPWKVGALLGGYYLLESMLKEMGGGDDDDKRKRKVLPQYMNDRLFGVGPHMSLQVPGMGDDRHPVYFKFGAFIPTGDLIQNDNKNGFMGLKWWPGSFTPNGPIVSMLAGAVFNIDPFTGKQISLNTDSQWDAFTKRAAYLEGQVVPPWADAERASETWDRLANDKKGPFGAEVSKDLEAAKLAGFRFQQVDLAAAKRGQEATVKGIDTEYKKAESKLKREAERYPAGSDERNEAKQKLADMEVRRKAAIANAKNEDE